MTKEIIEELAMLYALGTLADSETESFEELLRQDRSVRQLVHEYQRLIEMDVRAGSREAPPFQAYSGIMERIERMEGTGAEADTAVAAPFARRSSRFASVATWGGWGIAACACLAWGVSALSSKPAGPKSDIVLNTLANPRIVPVQTPSEDVSIEDRMFELSGLAEAYWFSREGVPASQQLASNAGDKDPEPLSGGFTIFDNAHQIGYIAVENLPREQNGKSYHVWAKTADGAKVVRAGALPIGNESRGLFFFDLSSLPKVKSLNEVTFFVTEESTEDPVKPGPTVVLSQL